MIVLSLSFHEVRTMCIIVQNLVQMLEYSKNVLYRLGGAVLKDLLTRLINKAAIEFYGEKKVKLNLKECLALKQFLLWLRPQEDEYSFNLRYKVFEQVDRKII